MQYYFFIQIIVHLFQESETGLYVSLVSFLGFGRNYVEQYFQKTGNAVFLHIKTDKELVRLRFYVRANVGLLKFLMRKWYLCKMSKNIIF